MASNGGAASGGGFTAMAVSNPMFTGAAKSAAFSALQAEEGDNELFNANAKAAVDPAALDVDEKELGQIRKWARMLRIGMLVICALMMITAFYNFGSTSSSSLATSFLAAYLLLFSCMLCCFEISLRRATQLMVENFGFMYNGITRFIFVFFVGTVCFEISTMGIVCFCLLLIHGMVTIYVHFRHPQYGRYLKAMHFYHRTSAKRGTTTV